MISAEDFIELPITPDLSEAGITYACRSLAFSTGKGAAPIFDHLRRRVAQAAAELAMRRFLNSSGVQFSIRGTLPFGSPERYDLSLHGQVCRLISCLISRAAQLAELRRDEMQLMRAGAMVPLEAFVDEGCRPEDLYLFVFVLGEVDVHRDAKPGCYIQPLPGAWARPVTWLPLAELAIKAESELPLTMEIGGLNEKREFVEIKLELLPKERVEVKQVFYSVAYIRTSLRPAGRVGLHSRVQRDACILQPGEWGNIRVGMEKILLAGWLTHAEFRRKSSRLPVGGHTYQFMRTREKNLLVPLQELNASAALLEWAREAQDEKK